MVNADEPALGGEEDDMPPMKMATDEEIARWSDELQDIDTQITRLSERKLLLQKVLGVLPDIEKLRGIQSDGETPVVPQGPLKLIDAIPLVLRKVSQPLTPAEIKLHLKDVGYMTEHGDGYFYTAIKRSVEKKRIIRTADKRYVPAFAPASA